MRDFHLPGRSPAYATHAMAATSMPAATLTALDVLRDGGNAMDAAIAAVAVLGVIEPHSTGIGGDCFCLWAAPGKPVVALNGSGRAPAGATMDFFESQGLGGPGAVKYENTSPHAVTIPGAIDAWETLLAAHGTRGLDTLLQPAIRFAEEGWPVHSRVSADWAASVGKLRKNGAEAFLPGGEAPKTGDIFVQKALANTLRGIAAKGAKAFYEGVAAADMVAALRSRGGTHTEEDFAAALGASDFVQPIHLAWRGYDIWQCPPNGSGLFMLMMSGILEGFDPSGDPLSVERLHRHTEAARLAYRDRDAFLADPAKADVPVAKLLDPAYHAQLRALIDPARAMPHMPLPGEAMLPAHRDTVYLCVVDRDGNACSFINSLFQPFGSGILAPESGVMLQNRGYGFVVEHGHPNCIAPGKRPMHTIIPGMLTKDGEAVMPFGVMGGHFQPMGQTLFLSNLLEYGLDIQEALDLPRLFPYQGKLEIEPGIPAETAAALARMGHDTIATPRPHGGGQAIWIDRKRGVLIGGSDPRKDGMALGY
jgi:gamma-glutamyltranspeptidase/glutathione hydrolase